MRASSSSLALALALGSLVAGCGPIAESCHPGTLLVVVTLDATTAAADTLAVTLSIDGVSKPSTLPHTPGHASGNIEVTFPQSYPRGSTVGITVQALAGTAVLGAGMTSQPLVASCEVTPLAVHGNAGDAGATDLADMLEQPPRDLTMLADQALPADLAPPSPAVSPPRAPRSGSRLDGGSRSRWASESPSWRASPG